MLSHGTTSATSGSSLVTAKRLPLPRSALLDTTALIPALGGKIRCEEDKASRDLFEAMLASSGHVIYIATPSVAELHRRAPKKPIPRTESVVVVPLDQRAAVLLGTKFPPSVLTTLSKKGAAPKHYIKYDAMIVACAVRWGRRGRRGSEEGKPGGQEADRRLDGGSSWSSAMSSPRLRCSSSLPVALRRTHLRRHRARWATLVKDGLGHPAKSLRHRHDSRRAEHAAVREVAGEPGL